MFAAPAAPAVVYERRRPESLALYKVVQDNLSTLYGAVDDGALRIALPKFVRKELEDFLTCGAGGWPQPRRISSRTCSRPPFL